MGEETLSRGNIVLYCTFCFSFSFSFSFSFVSACVACGCDFIRLFSRSWFPSIFSCGRLGSSVFAKDAAFVSWQSNEHGHGQTGSFFLRKGNKWADAHSWMGVEGGRWDGLVEGWDWSSDSWLGSSMTDRSGQERGNLESVALAA